MTIERVAGADFVFTTFPPGFEPDTRDFTGTVSIDSQQRGPSNVIQNDDAPMPDWVFEVDVDPNKDAVPVRIVVTDENIPLDLTDPKFGSGPLFPPSESFGDPEQMHFDPDISDAALNLTLDLNSCTVSGDGLTSPVACNTTIKSLGPDFQESTLTSGIFPNSGLIEYRIEVIPREPPAAPGLHIRCTHSPIWPQASDEVTIEADVLDDNLDSKTADEVEVWLNDPSAPAHSATGVSGITHFAGAFDNGSFSYGCRVRDEGSPWVFSGWRVVNVGPPNSGRAVPVSFTDRRDRRIDIVFLPDQDNYTGGNDPAFLADVETAIEGAYYDMVLFLDNQDMFNFWIAQDTADAEELCAHVGPTNAASYAFADARLILHTDNLRDCAMGNGLVSSEPTNFFVLLHESGHRPFGLADEYCCDGGYWQDADAPNVYSSDTNCQADAPNLGVDPSLCRSLVGNSGGVRPLPWRTSDPSGDDLMEDSGNHTPQPADVRRINFMFDKCRGSAC